jgi:methylated-DNA-[protein]-cysteine S-methyltransferase
MKKIKRSLDRKQIYDLASQIPGGRVSTYGAIAVASGRPKAARAVGRLMHMNPNPIVVPCHRVVGSDGSLVGYGQGVEIKAKILAAEGVAVVDNKVVDFQKKLFMDFR